MAKVNFKRIENSSSIGYYDVEDGTFWVTGDGKTYVDYGNRRISIAGTPDTQMSDISRNTVENNVIKEYVDNKIGNIHTYSTNEIDTGNIWIDGSHIYRKVINTGAISSAPKYINHNITNLSTVISLEGVMKAEGNFYKLPRVSSSNTESQVALNASSTQIILSAGNNANFSDSFVIIEYTKTT